jgi:hypothetical protein
MVITWCLIGVSSCTTPNFYQIYKVTPVDDNIYVANKSLVYEDNNCKVAYNFWGEGGYAGFLMYNKTDKNIYINKAKSFFICNGIAYDYFLNRTFTQSSNFSSTLVNRYNFANNSETVNANYSIFAIGDYIYGNDNITNGNTSSVTTSTTNGYYSGQSISIKESELVCIPPKSAKVIQEYKITASVYRNCNIYLYLPYYYNTGNPNNEKMYTIKFMENDSPLVFSNCISYSVNDSVNLINFENKFYVSEITNYREVDFVESKRIEICGERGYSLEEYFKYVSPDKFYIKYNKKVSTYDEKVFSH